MATLQYLFLLFILLSNYMINCEYYDKKTVDGMVLRMLWQKVYENYDPKTKEEAIKIIRKTGDYENVVNNLLKVKKGKVQKIIDLIGEFHGETTQTIIMKIRKHILKGIGKNLGLVT